MVLQESKMKRPDDFMGGGGRGRDKGSHIRVFPSKFARVFYNFSKLYDVLEYFFAGNVLNALVPY